MAGRTGSDIVSFEAIWTFGPLHDPGRRPSLESGVAGRRSVLRRLAPAPSGTPGGVEDSRLFATEEAAVTNHRRPTPVLVALASTLGIVLAYWRAPVPRGLLVDLLGIVVLATASVQVLRGDAARWSRRVVWATTGALVIAAVGSASWMPPWIALAALCLVVGGVRRATSRRGLAFVRALGLVALGALVNTYVLGALATRTPLSAEPEAFRALDLRAHSLLDDVPLRDVWAIDLPGGGESRTLLDLRELPQGDPSPLASLLPGALAAVRLAVGWVLRWDGETSADASTSYAYRLTAADRALCLRRCPGDRTGPFGFRLLFDSHLEVIQEVQNRTVHAFVVMAMAPGSDGYRLFVAIYVKRTDWFTPVYMATIDPFRRLIVYPAVLRRYQSRWRAKWGS